MSYDSRITRCLEWPKLEKQKVGGWLSGAGGWGGRQEVGNECLMGVGFQLGRWKVLEMMVGMIAQ